MGFDLKSVLSARSGEGAELWGRHLNPQTTRVLRAIGFDRRWERADGCYLFDDEGRSYLDFLSGFGVFGLGRNHPVIEQAIHDVVDAGLADMVQMDTPLLAGLLGESLANRASHLDRVYMCNSGTEAVEAALKFARYATGRSRILYCDHAFHGLTFGSLSVNGSNEFTKGFGQLLASTKIPFGDIGALRRELAAGDVAALIVEPVQGKGVHVAPRGYLATAAQALHGAGALLICDEVQAGLGRTGRFFSFEHDGVAPDLVTVAKTLSGGFVPVAATIGTSKVFEKVYSSLDRVLVHDGTYSHNNLASAVGLATLAVLDDEGLVENAARMGAELTEALNEVSDRYELVTEVRGRGLMIGIEFGNPSSLRLKASYRGLSLARKGLFTQMVVCALFEKHRILTQTAGDHMDVLKLLPPLVSGPAEVERFITAFASVMESVHSGSRPVWHFAKGLATRSAPAFSRSTGR